MNSTKQMRKYNGTLRPYQLDGVVDVRKSLTVGPTLLVSPTGAGKTNMAAVIAEDYRNVLFVAHRRELLSQASVPMGSHVVRMSIQSALRYGPDNVQCLIIDEAHRAKAKTYRLLIEKYATAARLGLTATPLRTDGQGLCDAFSQLVQVSSVKELVVSGHLVPYVPLVPPDEALAHLARLKKMKKRGGDYETRALNALMNTPRLVGQVVTEYLLHAGDRRAVCFAVSVAHSKALEAEFIRCNVRAVHIDGRASLKVRDAALAKVARGEIDVLCNVNLFTEGWDCPAISCVIMARPTASLTLYLQCVGRGMRPDEASGKQDVIILDHAGNMARHGMPDEDREWLLEGRLQREKRERETAELERIYALGYESLEQYRLEASRSLTETYSTLTVARLLNIAVTKVGIRLRRYGISTVYRRGRYPKEAIDQIMHFRATNYTSSECKAVLKTSSTLGYLLTHAPELLVVDGVKRRERNYYPKNEIDKLAERQSLYSSHYTAQQVKVILKLPINGGGSMSRYLRVRGITPIGEVYPALYPKAEVDRLAVALNSRAIDTYTKRQAADLLDVKLTSVPTFLKGNGILSCSGSTRGKQRDRSKATGEHLYPKGQIDALVERLHIPETYALHQVQQLLDAPVDAYQLKRLFGVAPYIPAAPGHRSRYLRTVIDDLVQNIPSMRRNASSTVRICEAAGLLAVPQQHVRRAIRQAGLLPVSPARIGYNSNFSYYNYGEIQTAVSLYRSQLPTLRRKVTVDTAISSPVVPHL